MTASRFRGVRPMGGFDLPVPEPETLRALTRKIYDDGRVDMALASIGDGVMLIRKR